jgi:hypothetical protein
MSFVDEGQNFRWIYDLDRDDVNVGPLGGICTVLSRPPSQSDPLPYSYAWSGAPGFTGVDCCSGRIESEVSGTVGTGQALFYYYLDPGNPAKVPPDSDRDGLRDLCDNCPSTPNARCSGPVGSELRSVASAIPIRIAVPVGSAVSPRRTTTAISSAMSVSSRSRASRAGSSPESWRASEASSGVGRCRRAASGCRATADAGPAAGDSLTRAGLGIRVERDGCFRNRP